MEMSKVKMKKLLERQFVEDYEIIKGFMEDINNFLENLEINGYKNYDEFCLEIEYNVFKLFDKNNIQITPEIMAKSLNNMIEEKIILDEKFEEKLKKYFDSDDLTFGI